MKDNRTSIIVALIGAVAVVLAALISGGAFTLINPTPPPTFPNEVENNLIVKLSSTRSDEIIQALEGIKSRNNVTKFYPSIINKINGDSIILYEKALEIFKLHDSISSDCIKKIISKPNTDKLYLIDLLGDLKILSDTVFLWELYNNPKKYFNTAEEARTRTTSVFSLIKHSFSFNWHSINESPELLDFSNLNKTTTHNATLKGLDFSRCQFEKIEFTKVDARETLFNKCKFTDILFNDCNLSNINFTTCSFRNVQFLRCDLSQTVFLQEHNKEIKITNSLNERDMIFTTNNLSN